MKIFCFVEKLNFANNDITDESIDAIVKLLSGTSKIKYLDLTNNKIGCEGAKQLSTFISSAPKGGLETLILSLNNLKEDGCGAMCKVNFCVLNIYWLTLLLTKLNILLLNNLQLITTTNNLLNILLHNFTS